MCTMWDEILQCLGLIDNLKATFNFPNDMLVYEKGGAIRPPLSRTT